MEHQSARCIESHVAETRYRVPDVVVFSRDNPIEQILTTAPIAVFEILSPEDRMPRMLEKLRDYARMEIQTIRVIDPATKVVYAFTEGNLEPLSYVTEALEGSLCSINWDQLREFLD